MEPRAVEDIFTDEQYRPPRAERGLMERAREKALADFPALAERYGSQICNGAHCLLSGRLCEHFSDRCPLCYMESRRREEIVDEGKLILSIFASAPIRCALRYCPACYLAGYSFDETVLSDAIREKMNKRGREHPNRFGWLDMMIANHSLSNINRGAPSAAAHNCKVLDLLAWKQVRLDQRLILPKVRRISVRFPVSYWGDYSNSWKRADDQLLREKHELLKEKHELLKLKYTALLSQVREEDRGRVGGLLQILTLHHQASSTK